jgi:hypothetical protein
MEFNSFVRYQNTHAAHLDYNTNSFVCCEQNEITLFQIIAFLSKLPKLILLTVQLQFTSHFSILHNN